MNEDDQGDYTMGTSALSLSVMGSLDSDVRPDLSS
jgi:hypothetical protein